MRHEAVAVVRADSGDLQTAAVYLAHALLAQLGLHRLEELPDAVPRVGHIRRLEASLLNQIVPEVDRRRGLLDRHQVEAALLRRLVKESRVEQCTPRQL